MLTVFEVVSNVCVLTDLAIVLLMLAHGGKSLMLIMLEVGVTMGTPVTFGIKGV